MTKAIIFLVVILSLSGMGWWYWQARASVAAEAPTTQDTATVSVGNVVSSVASTGRVVSNLDVDIKCKASGQIVTLPYDVSQTIPVNAVLMTLDPIYEQRNVALAAAQVQESDAKLAQAKENLIIAQQNLVTSRGKAEAGLKSAEARAKDARSKADRRKNLLAQGTVMQEDFDSAESTAEQAEADVQTATMLMEDLKAQETALELRAQDVKLAESQLRADKVALDAANQRLTDTQVLAPPLPDTTAPGTPAIPPLPASNPSIDSQSPPVALVSADMISLPHTARPTSAPASQPAANPYIGVWVVSALDVQLGKLISSPTDNTGGGDTIMTLSDLSRIFILASVDESDIGRVAVGQNVDITADSYPGMHFLGIVELVPPAGVSANNVTTFQVKIEVTSANKTLLKPQMTANTQIVIDHRDDVLSVPETCLFQKDGQSFVTRVQKDGSRQDVPVVVDLIGGDNAAIKSGLSKDDVVIDKKEEALSKWRADPSKMKIPPGMMAPKR